MNYRYVAGQVGFVLLVLTAAMGAVWLGTWVDFYHTAETDGAGRNALLISALIGLVLGGGLRAFARFKKEDKRENIGRREALLLVSLSWVLGSAFVSIPYYLWAQLYTHIDDDHIFLSLPACLFEGTSGLTTTGATVLVDIPTLPAALLMWRSLTHWLGGLGIVVLFVAVLPSLGVGGKKLFKVESSSLTAAGVRPRIREMARILWLIYVGLTIIQILLLWLAGMDFGYAIDHAFSSLATGGFSTANASASAFSAAVQWILIAFMLMAGVNFGLYYALLQGQWRNVWKDPELRAYLGMVGIVAALTAWNVWGHMTPLTTGEVVEPGPAEALRHGLFQSVSLHTGTGLATVDYENWPFFAIAPIILLTFIGPCAGSTGGGIKVIRVLIALKLILVEVERVFRPNLVRPVKLGRGTIDPDMRQSALVYVLLVPTLTILGAGALMFLERDNAVLLAQGLNIDFTTGFTAAAATLNNVGPGLALVGPTDNYGWFSSPSLMLMSLLMILGRLEIYAVLVLFAPSFWRQD